jgi:hypothetical protein
MRFHNTLNTLAVVVTGFVLTGLCLSTLCQATGIVTRAQEKAPPESKPADRPGAEYTGMYSFLKEGEFVQVTVEDAGRVTGFISRYGDLDSDKGAFLDQFFKTGKVEGTALTFTTEVVHGTNYDFKGTIERGEGKKPGDEAYYVIRGTLTEILTDANKKTSSRSQTVTFKSFPQEASPVPPTRE